MTTDTFPEANPNPVLSAGADGVPRFVNPAALQLIKELKLQRVEDILPRNHKELVQTCLKTGALQIEEQVTSGRSIAWYYRAIGRDAIYIYGHDVSSYRFDHTHTPGLPRTNPNPVLSCSADGEAQFINPTTLQLIQQLKLGSVEDLLPQDHRKLVRRCLETATAITQEHAVKGRSIAWSYCAVENSASLVYIYGHDVTDYRSSISGTDDLPVMHAVLDNLITPILIVDRSLRVHFRNHAAEEFMSDDGGLRIEDDQLCGPVSSVTRKLRELVENTQENGTALKIPRFYEEGVYEILVSPLRLEKFSQSSSLLIVYLFDPQLALGAFNDILTSLYGLTPAEVRLTERLVKGDTLQQAVEELGIAMSTARTQLKFVFRKTGATHQSDLIRRIIMGPAGQARLQ